MSENKHLILGFIDNLMFSTRVESVVDAMGFRIHWMGQGDQDSTQGVEKSILDQINQLVPGLILVDLGMGSIPWEAVLRGIKSHPSTQRIPVVCFGSHMDADTLKSARQAGADEVVARSRFFSAIPKFIEKYLE